MWEGKITKALGGKGMTRKSEEKLRCDQRSSLSLETQARSCLNSNQCTSESGQRQVRRTELQELGHSYSW